MRMRRGGFQTRRIAVLMGGTSAERSISLKTGKAVLASLKRQGLTARGIDAQADLPQQLKRHRINFAFIALHGPGGEDGVVQGLLEWLKIPYTGSGILASALAMDKVASKRAFESAGLPTAAWRCISKADAMTRSPLRLPVAVKPPDQGSAIGISIVRSPREWSGALKTGFRYGPTVLVESFLKGPEITIGMLGDEALPIVEIVAQAGAFYDFKSKYAPGGSRHILPARISAAHARQSRQMAIKACQILGIRGAARVDLIVDHQLGPCLLEVNTIPGMTETSLLPEAARAAGYHFDALVRRIGELAHGV